MKYFLIACILSCFSLVSFGQISGGKIPTSGKRNPHELSVAWDNKNLFSFARTIPKGYWTKAANSYGNIKNGQAGMKEGFGVAYGQVFYLRQDEWINPGLSVTYFDISAYPDEGTDGEKDWSFMGSFKIGPMYSANLIDKLIVDVKLTVQPSYIYYQRTYGSAESDPESSYEQYDNIWGDGFLLRFGAAFQMRYEWLMFGVEYSWGEGDFEGQNEDYYIDTDWTGSSVNLDLEDTTLNFNTNRLDIYFGFCF